jgi:Transcriptional regulator, AbiEi antitoxin
MGRVLPAACRDLLELQDGVISRAQALPAGLGGATVRSMVRSGRWQLLHRGVYLAHSGPPGPTSLLWAALLRAGPAAVLSHRTAAELDRLVPPGNPAGPVIHVSVPRNQHVSPIRGVVLHRRTHLDRYRHPVAQPPRTRIEHTTLDLALGSRSLDDAMAWLARACGSRLTSAARLEAALAARPHVRWRLELTAALADVGTGAESSLELRYLRRVERPHGLPAGTRQARSRQGSRRVYRDVLYELFGVVVETDGAVAHPPETRWRDQERDNAAGVRDVITLRYGWGAVTERPCSVAAEVAATLRRRGWAGRMRPCGSACAAAAPAARNA